MEGYRSGLLGSSNRTRWNKDRERKSVTTVRLDVEY